MVIHKIAIAAQIESHLTFSSFPRRQAACGLRSPLQATKPASACARLHGRLLVADSCQDHDRTPLLTALYFVGTGFPRLIPDPSKVSAPSPCHPATLLLTLGQHRDKKRFAEKLILHGVHVRSATNGWSALWNIGGIKLSVPDTLGKGWTPVFDLIALNEGNMRTRMSEVVDM